MNIYQRINEVRKDVSYLQKDKDVSAGPAGTYKAVTHDKVTAVIRAALIKNGIVICPSQIKGELDQPALKYDQKAGQMVPSSMRLYRATYKISFVNAESPDDRVDVDVEAHALDNGDKAPGKAMSYATKYAILKLFSLETGEDEESRYQEPVQEPIPVINESQISQIKDLIEATETDESVFLAAGKFGVPSLDMIPSPLFDRAISMLEKKQKAILAKVSAE